jgi:gamma-glutamyl hercynylcysteine S-oxide synthase
VVCREVASFEISIHPVTVAQFQRFVDDGGYADHKWWKPDGWVWRIGHKCTVPHHWEEQVREPTCPVTWISYHEAEAFARWLSRETPELCCEIPSEAQWECAARHGTANDMRFPWGEELSPGEEAEANWARCGLRHKTPVGLFPRSNTKAGVTDMFGNVEEWCSGPWYPRHECDEGPVIPLSKYRPARGGSALRYSRLCRPSYRSRLTSDLRYESVGFRVVRARQAVA